MIVNIVDVRFWQSGSLKIELFDDAGDGVVKNLFLTADQFLDFRSFIDAIEGAGMEKVLANGKYTGVDYSRLRPSWEECAKAVREALDNFDKGGSSNE